VDLLRTIIYGVIQGLTEYLPVSSTAHIRVIPALLGWPDPGAAYTAVIQIGTILAVLIYFAKDIGRALGAWVKSFFNPSLRETPDAKLGWAVFVGTFPVAIVGFIFRHQIENQLRSLYVVAISLIVMGVVLWLTELVGSKRRGVEKATLWDGVIVGLWQCISLIPGASRSGSTISGALVQGFDRAAAARFAFLLSVPSVLASGLFELMQYRHVLLQQGPSAIVVGNLVSFVVGYASIAWLMRLLQTRSLLPFVVYRIGLGLLLIGLLASGYLLPTAGQPQETASKHVLQKTTS
jgi:undecaprenyl-diphosphatase